MKKLILIFSICTIAWLGVGGCGDDDCPTCPQDDSSRYEGYAYVAMLGVTPGIFVIDIAADSIVDSIVDSEIFPAGAVGIDIMADGGYLIASNTRGILTLFRLPEFTVITQVEMLGEKLLVPWKNALLQHGPDGLALYRLPELEVIVRKTPPFGTGAMWLDERSNAVLTVAGPDSLALFDLDSLGVVGTWHVKDLVGSGFILHKLCWNAESGKVFLLAESISGADFVVFDLNESTVISRTQLLAPFGDLRLSPIRKEVYVTDPGYIGSGTYPGTIYVFDAENGGLNDVISLYGLYPGHPWMGLAASILEVTPDGKDLIVGVGGREQPGNILRIRSSKRKVEKVYFEDYNWLANDIVIGK